MQHKLDEASTAQKVLRLFQKLLADGKKHYQTDLAAYLKCSSQTVMRLIGEIESIVGISLVTGLDKHRRWYQLSPIAGNKLGLEYEELRYLAICRDLAAPYLPENIKKRLDSSLFNFSMLMADKDYHLVNARNKNGIYFNAKGKIDYTPYFGFLETFLKAKEEKRVCLVEYKPTAKNKVTTHYFAVNLLLAMHNALYALGASLTADCEEKKFFTNLAIHRIKKATLLSQKWREDVDMDDLGMFGLPWHEPRTFAIHFRAGRIAEYVRERIWSDGQRITELQDGSIILEIESRSQPEIEAWVRSFGDGARLL